MLIVFHLNPLFELCEEQSVIHHPTHFSLKVLPNIVDNILAMLILQLEVKMVFGLFLLPLPYLLELVIVLKPPLILGFFLLDLK
jgi:hypothetical protein